MIEPIFKAKELKIYSGYYSDTFYRPLEFFVSESLTIAPVEKTNLSGVKSIYFSKNSKVSRSKFADKTDIKRVIKPENADIVAFPEGPPQNTRFEDMLVFKDLRTNEYIVIGKKAITNSKIPTGSGEEVIDFLIKKGKIEKNTYEFIGKESIARVNKSDADKYDLLMKNPNFITDDNVESIINSSSQSLSDEEISTIDNYLSSSDSDSVEMGLNLLMNFNYLEYPCTVGVMLLKNHRQIMACKKYNSKSVKLMLGALNITLYNDPNDPTYYLRMINSLHSKSVDPKDKSVVNRIAEKAIYEVINRSIEGYKKILSSFSIKTDIKVTV